MHYLLKLRAVAVLCVAFACPAIAQQMQSPTRITSFDWQCQDAKGAKLSDHQRFDTALVACMNNAAGDRIQGGTYKLNRAAPTQSVGGTASISWVPPTKNTDGTALTDLAGYRILYGVSVSAHPRSAAQARSQRYRGSSRTWSRSADALRQDGWALDCTEAAIQPRQ